ncbi:uncharacterized protein CTRU02_204252 [Colletotrichum truncatum]|uniref:Uncharacterized protein n=1 Tax=Colletotrichum truncatum TaxID=5467 RepID=A0ACC3ZBG7_COLTU|nr:uncharacterized protein CTRU02_10103 [Colletotrichum truncatum]KAF6787808.1 hypothetical protein CTRU02_10103 [Colletotrichum truncatum]
MTVEKCAAFCSAFALFGVEYGRECFCGNARDPSSQAADPSDCNFRCSGDSRSLCGASNRLNIYSNLSPTTQGPATLPGITSLGCFVDSIPRKLPSKTISDGSMTAAKCAASCAGYTYFGTQWSSECYCGNTVPDISAPISDCNMVCSGNYNEFCGGSMRLNIYKVDQTSATKSTSGGTSGTTVSNGSSLGGFTYRSCWTDTPYDRSLKAIDYRADDMTVEKCAERCKAYTYFGLEYSRECFCGDDLIGQAAPEDECKMSCMGAGDQKCGDSNRLNIYSKQTLSASPSYSSSSTSVTSSWSSTISTSPTSFSTSLSSSTSKTSSSLKLSESLASHTSSPASTTSLTPQISSSTSTTTSTSQTSSSSSLTTLSTSRTSSMSMSTSSGPQIPSSTSITSSASQTSSSSSSSSSSLTSDLSKTTGPAMTTVTSCAATATYNGTPEYCFTPGNLPTYCEMMFAEKADLTLDQFISYCKPQLSANGLPANPQALACLNANTYKSIPSANSCLNAPSASLICQYDTACVTKTYVVGQVPTASPATTTPTIGINLFGDGGWESGNTNPWEVSNDDQLGISGKGNFMEVTVNSVRPRSGKYSLSALYTGINYGAVSFIRMQKVVPGKTYQLQFYVWSTKAGTNTGVQVNLEPGGFAIGESSLNSTPTNQWVKRTLTIKTITSFIKLKMSVTGSVYGSNNINQIYIDDISFMQLD